MIARKSALRLFQSSLGTSFPGAVVDIGLDHACFQGQCHPVNRAVYLQLKEHLPLKRRGNSRFCVSLGVYSTRWSQALLSSSICPIRVREHAVARRRRFLTAGTPYAALRKDVAVRSGDGWRPLTPLIEDYWLATRAGEDLWQASDFLILFSLAAIGEGVGAASLVLGGANSLGTESIALLLAKKGCPVLDRLTDEIRRWRRVAGVPASEPISYACVIPIVYVAHRRGRSRPFLPAGGDEDDAGFLFVGIPPVAAPAR